VYVGLQVKNEIFCERTHFSVEKWAKEQAWCEIKILQFWPEPCCRAKAELRSALQDATRSTRALEVPTGLGARARQRRFPPPVQSDFDLSGLPLAAGCSLMAGRENDE
jgi:hypothetical protein